MPKTSRKHGKKTRKQKMYVMKGCAEKSRKKKVFSSLGNHMCPKCGPNCMCGPNCNCSHKCPGNCYLNRPLKHKGGNGCGPGGCPIAPFSWAQMNATQGGSLQKRGSRQKRGSLQKRGSRQRGTRQKRGSRQRGGLYPPNHVMDTGFVLPYGKNPLGSIGQVGSGQLGGSCGPSCGLQPPQMQFGGSFYKPGPPEPGPFVGSSWGSSVSKWPGIDGIGGNRNFIKNYDVANNNIITKDPQLQQLTADIDAGYKTLGSMVGGYKYKNNNRTKKGGGLIPQDLVNLGQDFTFNLKSAYNSLNGYSAPVSPLPYKDQLSHSLNNNPILL